MAKFGIAACREEPGRSGRSDSHLPSRTGNRISFHCLAGRGLCPPRRPGRKEGPSETARRGRLTWATADEFGHSEIEWRFAAPPHVELPDRAWGLPAAPPAGDPQEHRKNTR